MSGALAQMHHVDAPQRVTRAIGVYEWTGDLAKPSASRFVPVSLFIDGHFEDAGLYLARPVPFALQTGNLYTVEHAGESEGVLDVEQAERVVSGNALADDNPVGAWYGFGKFTADAAPKPAPALHKSAHVGVIQSTSADASTGKASAGEAGDDGRPHMNRRAPASDSKEPDSPTSGHDASTTGTGSSEKGSNSGGDDTDRPTLARRDPSQDAARRRGAAGGKKGGTASVTSVGPAPGEDPDRPTLSHNTAASEGPKVLTGMPADLRQAVAVSDAVSRDPHPFARGWETPAERADTLSALSALAKTKVSAYLNENRLAPSVEVAPAVATSESKEGVAAATENGAGAPPKLQRGRPTEYGAGAAATVGAGGQSTPPKQDSSKPNTATGAARTSRRRPTVRYAAAPALLLRNEQIAGFTLSYGGLPTFVYSAVVPAVLTQAKDVSPAAAHVTVFITLVAQRLPSGELQVALSSATDSAHLDRSARLQLVDAVDPDASHRASLLFELRGGNSRQFALYRLTSARAENTFTSASIE